MNRQNQILIMTIRKSTNSFKTTIYPYLEENIMVNKNEKKNKIIIRNLIKIFSNQNNKAQRKLKVIGISAETKQLSALEMFYFINT